MRFAFISCALALGFAPAKGADRADAQLAFVRESADGRREAYVVTLHGDRAGTERALDEGPWQSYPAAFGPNGARAILRVDREGASLAVRFGNADRAETVAPKVVARAGLLREPVFAPDGSALAYESDAYGFRDLHLVNRAGSGAQLTHDAEGDFEPSFFPDGRSIAFTSSRDGQTEIYRLGIGDAEAVRLTSSPGEDFAPQVSPDGTRIAFLTGRSGRDRVWLMNADGTNAHPLRTESREADGEADEREHTWSPDGKRLAFVARVTGRNARVMLFDVVQQTVATITDDRVASDMPAFSPDGRRLAFVSESSGIPDLFVANADGTKAQRVFDQPEKRWRPVWIR